MPTFHRETWVDAPLSEVWAFHSRIDGLVETTPAFANLEIESVTGADGEPDPEVLGESSRIEVSVRPVEALPRLSWTSVVVDREAGDDRAFFRDEMEEGPLTRWVHTHRFYGDDGRTLVSDEVEYRLPGGGFGRQLEPLADVVLDQVFAYRHRRTKELLE
jgi:ligand-binding SRPBCC domain-containing protein